MNHPNIPPNIPPDSPPDLHILAENMKDILESVEAVKGDEYATIAITLTTLLQQSAQLERIACQFTSLRTADDSDELRASAEMNHTITHIIGEASSNAIHRLIDWFSSTSAFKGMDSDVRMIMQRIKTDWIDKGHS